MKNWRPLTIALGFLVLVTSALSAIVVVGQVAERDYVAPRTASGRPTLNGIWQAIGSHHHNIEPHAASHGPVVELAAHGAIPGGLGIVVGGQIPYTATARAQQQDNLEHWLERDPAVKCYLPGVPRAAYMPYPFQIVQTEQYILIAYEFASASRIVYMDRPDFDAPVDAWMGHSLGSWDGETLVINVTAQVPDTWLDRSGNHHSNSLHVVERYTATGPNHLMYEATIEDPEVYTRPWTIRVPLYRRLDENMQLLEYNCVEFAEELMYGHLRQNPDLTPMYRPSGFGSHRDGGVSFQLVPEVPPGNRSRLTTNQLLQRTTLLENLRTALVNQDAESAAALFAQSVGSQERGITFGDRVVSFTEVFSRVHTIQLEYSDDEETPQKPLAIRIEVAIRWRQAPGSEEEEFIGFLSAGLQVDNASADLRFFALTLPIGRLLGQ